MRTLLSLIAAMTIGSAACGPRTGGGVGSLPEGEVAKLYGPEKLEVLPFTKFRSFDKDPIPDGLEVALRPVDAMGDPVKAYGTFMFELFEYRMASGRRAGDRLESWTQTITTIEEQKRFWDRVTSTYVFQLTWEGGQFPEPQRKYVLAASLEEPGGQRMFAEYVFEFRMSRGQVREAIGGDKQ